MGSSSHQSGNSNDRDRGLDNDTVIARFQDLMSQFLETQKAVMTAYLNGADIDPEKGFEEAIQAMHSVENLLTASSSIQEQSSEAKGETSSDEISEIPEPKTQDPKHDSKIIEWIAPTPVSRNPGETSQKTSRKNDLNTEESSGGEQAATEDGTLSRQDITGRLYHAVASCTGHPEETLTPELNLPALLDGNHAAKEKIIAKFISELNEAAAESKELTREDYDSECLRLVDMVDWAARALVHEAAPEKKFIPRTTVLRRKAGEISPSIRRFTLHARERELIMPPRESISIVGDTILVTRMPKDPVATNIISKLQSFGRRVITMEHGHSSGKTDAKSDSTDEFIKYTCDFRSFKKLSTTLNKIKKKNGPISGLMHLVPLFTNKPFETMEITDWKQQLALTVKSLFYLTKLLENDLVSAAEKGDASVVAATALGGTFASQTGDGRNSEKPEFFPGSGGISGFLKALAREIPSLNIRAVDSDPADSPEEIATQLTNELLTPSADIEVGYQAGRRCILDIREVPVEITKLSKSAIDSSWCLLITGGARGIASSIALDLARRFQPTLLLVGRTPLDGEEDQETAGIVDRKQLAAIMEERLQAQKGQISPIDVENACQRLLNQREIRQTLKQLRETGSGARYFQTDVTDPEAFSQLIETIYKEYRRIDGVIHCTGRFEEEMIADKNVSSFNRVFDTRADSLFTLSKNLRQESLRFLALFSSVSGRFGKAGQVDYSAADEVYNKTAIYLNRLWPSRVVSFNWGPWQDPDTVSPRKKNTEDGIPLISPDVGTDLFYKEISHGEGSEVEVIYGGWADREKDLSPATRVVLADQ